MCQINIIEFFYLLIFIFNLLVLILYKFGHLRSNYNPNDLTFHYHENWDDGLKYNWIFFMCYIYFCLKMIWSKTGLIEHNP